MSSTVMFSKNKVSPTNLKFSPEKSELKYTVGKENFEKNAAVSSNLTSFRKNFKNYCTETSLHGFRYITKSDISTPEQIIWFFIVLISVVVCLILVYLSYNWSRGIPTVTVIESTHYPIMNVPFPAVTFCSKNRISRKKAHSLAEKLVIPSNMTTDELEKLFTVALHFNGNSQYQPSKYIELDKVLKSNNLTVIRLLELLVPACSDILIQCSWRGSKVQCDEIFQDIISADGFCCSFNYLGLNHTTSGKLASIRPKRPYHVSSCGYQTALTVTLDPNILDFYGSYLSSYGFRALLHNSFDYPDTNAETKVLPLNTESFISILPQSFYATEEVVKLQPLVRNCHFHYERKMNVMQRYSFINCMAECRAMYAYQLCGCIPLRFLNNGSFPSCNMLDIGCIIKNINTITGALPGLNKTILRNFNRKEMPCNCLPDCEMIMYPAEIAAAELTWPDSPGNIGKTVKMKNKVIAHVYFSDLVSTRYRKDIFTDWIKMLATFGGLLGLVMGFSILTGFEFLYYLLIRPIFDILKRRNESF